MTEVLLSTFFGGDGSEGCETMRTDSNGEIIIAGHTISNDFPVTSKSFNPTYDYNVCFVSKLQGNLAVTSLPNIDNNELKIYPKPVNAFISILGKIRSENIQIHCIDGRIYKTTMKKRSNETICLFLINFGLQKTLNND